MVVGVMMMQAVHRHGWKVVVQRLVQRQGEGWGPGRPPDCHAPLHLRDDTISGAPSQHEDHLSAELRSAPPSLDSLSRGGMSTG